MKWKRCLKMKKEKKKKRKSRWNGKHCWKNQKAQGLEILATNQRISRLPITLAQLRGVDNSEKLKNEIRQQLYSLYRS